jgi:hypothetical protein
MATTYTPEQYLAQYCPALYALGSGVYTFWLESTLNRMNPAVTWNGWGSLDARNEAQAYLAIHRWAYLTGAYTDLGGGVISANPTGETTSRASGQESVSFGFIGFNAANIQRADVNLTATRWGLLYLALRDSRPAFGGFTAVAGC